MTQYAESWLWLGELRNIVEWFAMRISTEEEDEIYFNHRNRFQLHLKPLLEVSSDQFHQRTVL